MSREDNLRDAGRRLAKDLKDLREDRQVKVEILLKKTRLPADILQKFDETALVDHPAFNKVYLRSVVSSYAKVLDIDVGLARKALQQALEGRYKDLLRKKYLTDAPSSEAEEIIKSEADTSEEDAVRMEPNFVEETATNELSANDLSAKASDPENFMPRAWVIVSAVILTVAVIWSLTSLFMSDSSSTNSESSDAAINGEPSILPITPSTPIPPPEFIILPDSMQFDVIAEYEKVDPIRVTRDRWGRRPYWIEHGDTLTFMAANSITFESDIESARIELEGFSLPDSLVDSEGRIELSRDRAQRWLDSLIVIRQYRK